MSKPIYIICSKDGTEDKDTGAVSFFHVLEKLSVFRVGQQPASGGAQLFGFRVCAMWMKEPGDENTEFEWELLFESPLSKKSNRVANGTFSFEEDPTKVFWRLMMNIHGQPPVDGSGILSVKHRVRPVGATDWQTQEFPVVVEEVNAGNAVGQAIAPA